MPACPQELSWRMMVSKLAFSLYNPYFFFESFWHIYVLTLIYQVYLVCQILDVQSLLQQGSDLIANERIVTPLFFFKAFMRLVSVGFC